MPKSPSSAGDTGGTAQEAPSGYSEPHIVSFHVLRSWDGYVVDVRDDRIVARLTSLSTPNAVDSEEAEIPLEELDDDTKAQMKPGRYFRWSIGYERSRGGQKTRVSRMVVRRVPAFTKSDLAQANDEVKRIAKNLTWD
jgi:hypothetical protein